MGVSIFAQNDQSNEEIKGDEPYSKVEQMPVFEGGEAAMFKYLGENIVYPEASQKKGHEGVVYLTFVIEKTGRLSSVEVLRGVDKDIDAEALRVVKSTDGKWSPGYHEGEPVRVQYNLPIRFTLRRPLINTSIKKRKRRD